MSNEHSHLIRRLTESDSSLKQWGPPADDLEATSAALQKYHSSRKGVKQSPHSQPPIKGAGPEPEAKKPKSQGFGSVKGVEAEPGDTHDETTIREVLQLGVVGLEMMFTSLADDLEENQEELTNFDAPALISHLRAAAGVLRNSTGA